MRIKRVLQGTALTALAAAAWMGATSVDASAATIPTDNIKVDTDAQSMNVKTNDAEVLFAVGTYSTRNKSVKVSAWDVYDVADKTKGVDIDLSKLSNVKDNYIVVKTEKADPTYIKISASLKGQKLTFNAGNRSLKIEPKSGATNPSGKWEYRTSYGDWQDLATTNEVADVFGGYQNQGASLYVRAKAATVSSITAIDEKVSDAADPDKKEISVYNAGSLPGKETKLNISKRANGPTITADYVNRTVKFKNGSTYRVWAADASGNYTIVTAETNAPTDKQELSDIITATNGVIEARIPAKTENKGKAASKWARLVVNKSEKIVCSVTTTKVYTATEGAVTVSNGIKITPQKNSKGAYTKKIAVENATGCAISVKVGTKTTTIAANTTKNVAAAIDTGIEIAIAGDKKAGKWLGEYTKIGHVE